jgi:AcrR family transcriptional regulator
MANDQKIEAKQRIFDAAVRLFARKGYAAVGIREIAKEAGVQASMINYYFDGKISILKAIMDECYTRYIEAISIPGDEKTPIEDRVRPLIRNLVNFYREHPDLANAAFGSIPVDIPEIIDYRIKWFESHRNEADNWFKILGLDPTDVVLTSVLRDFLGKIIEGFFRARYCCDRIAEEPVASDHVKEHFKHDDHSIPLDEEFYEKYVDYLTRVYLYGITDLRKKK